MIKGILKYLIVYFILSVFFYLSGYSQCSNCGSNYPSGTFTTTSNTFTNVSTGIWGSEYHYATLSTGYIYQWTTEGTSYDTQLTLYPSGTCANTSTTWHPGPYLLAYNDDYSPPGSNLSSIVYQPGITSVRVLFSQYNCTSNSTSGTVKWRRIPTTPTISATSTTICSGGSTTLTASNISSDDDYINVMWGTTSGGTEVSADSYSVTVSPTSTTTYYLRYFLKGGTATSFYSGAGIYSNIASLTVTVQSPPTAPTTISGTTTICNGSNTSLTASGGSNGSGANFNWYSGACGPIFSQEWFSQPYGTGGTTVNAANGILDVTSTNGDPMIMMYGLGSFNPNIYKYIQIRYRVISGTAGNTEIFFTNGLYGTANGSQMVSGSMVSDGNWHILNIDMSSHPNWTHSNITGWRYDWATQSGARVQIDYISLGAGLSVGQGNPITVSPTTNTTYYVQRVGTTSCTNTTGCASTTVTVQQLSTIPTSINAAVNP